MRRTKRTALAAAALLAATTGVIATSAPAQAAARDGVCQSGEFCYYYNSNHEGSVSDFTGSIADYGTTQPSCYDYKGPGAGKGLCIKNDAASVWNRTGKKVRVYYNTGYDGSRAYQDFAAGAKKNLNATMKNNNASHKIGVSGGTGSQFLVPFPCNETWAGQTRSNHSPVNSVDFNHYPDDYGYKVYASAAGTVSRVGNTGSTSYGRYVYIDHGNGWQTRYAHLSSQNVSVGQQVGVRTLIGRVGSTGGSSGPHLHYEQRLNGNDVKVTFKGGNAVYFGTKNFARTTGCP